MGGVAVFVVVVVDGLGDECKMVHIKNISELLPDEPIKDPFEDEIHFNNTVREYVVS